MERRAFKKKKKSPQSELFQYKRPVESTTKCFSIPEKPISKKECVYRICLVNRKWSMLKVVMQGYGCYKSSFNILHSDLNL